MRIKTSNCEIRIYECIGHVMLIDCRLAALIVHVTEFNMGKIGHCATSSQSLYIYFAERLLRAVWWIIAEILSFLRNEPGNVYNCQCKFCFK